MSHVQATLTITNRGRAVCTLSGYARVRFLDGQGRPIPLGSHRRPGTAPRMLSISPRHKAQFEIEFGSSEPYESGRCPAPAAEVQVFAGRNKLPISAKFMANACTGVTVSPFAPPTSP